jgi:hypothetical protein
MGVSTFPGTFDRVTAVLEHQPPRLPHQVGRPAAHRRQRAGR